MTIYQNLPLTTCHNPPSCLLERWGGSLTVLLALRSGPSRSRFNTEARVKLLSTDHCISLIFQNFPGTYRTRMIRQAALRSSNPCSLPGSHWQRHCLAVSQTPWMCPTLGFWDSAVSSALNELSLINSCIYQARVLTSLRSILKYHLFDRSFQATLSEISPFSCLPTSTSYVFLLYFTLLPYFTV